jgi:signal transduction histidine kinase
MAGRQGSTTLEERSALPPRVAGSLIRGGILFIGAHTLLVALALALAGGTITISSGQAIIDETTEADWGTAAPGRYAFVQVADGGVGMAPEIKKKIFKAFFTTKEKGKGTGLGLSAVQDLARESDGFVQINSEPGKGTEVKVFLRSRRARRAT